MKAEVTLWSVLRDAAERAVAHAPDAEVRRAYQIVIAHARERLAQDAARRPAPTKPAA